MKSDINNKLKVQKLLSFLVTGVGILLMVFMIMAESEPGAIPLVMIVAGIGWYLVTRYKIRSQHT